MEIVALYPLSYAEVLGGKPPTFLDRAFKGRLPEPVDALTGDALLSVVLAGGYPEVLTRSTAKRRRDWCRGYIDAIAERDIREIANVGKLGEMPRLLEVLSQLSGQLVNLSEIGGRLGVDHKTVDRGTIRLTYQE